MTCTSDYDRGKQQTRPLVRDGVTHPQTRNCLTLTKIWGLTPRLTGRLTVGHNVTL
jgi:hypothetical protein